MKKLLENKVFKITTKVIRGILIAILAVYVLLVAVQRLSGNQSIMGYRFFTIVTGSMAGVYDINDVIAVQDCDTNKLKVGDDIAYMGSRAGLEGKIIVHRIVRIEDTSNGGRIFTTKGVKSANEDPAFRDQQVLGQVVGKIPVITQINHVIRSQLGFFTIVFVPLVLIIVLEILQTITDYQLDKKKIQEIKKEVS